MKTCSSLLSSHSHTECVEQVTAPVGIPTMWVPKPLFLFLIAGAELERPCQETAVLAGGSESWSNMSPPDVQICDYVLLCDLFFTFADVIKVSILHYESKGQILNYPMGLRGQLRYPRRVAGSERPEDKGKGKSRMP